MVPETIVTRDHILKSLAEKLPQLRQSGVRSLAIFGSVARGEDRPVSDVDIVVDFESGPTFDLYMSIKLYLEDLLGRRVDLLTRGGVRPLIRERIEHEAIHVT